MPPVTFIVVQKRHHTRFFPADNQTDKSGNIQPGFTRFSRIDLIYIYIYESLSILRIDRLNLSV